MDNTPKAKDTRRSLRQSMRQLRQAPPLIPRPLRLNETGAGAAQLLLLAVSTIRGIDYATGEGRGNLPISPTLSIVEESIPGGLTTWGIWFLVGTVIVIGGLLSGKLYAETVGHGLIGVAYFGVGVGQLIIVMENSQLGDWVPGLPVWLATGSILAASAFIWVRRNAGPGSTKDVWHLRMKWLLYGLPRGIILYLLVFGGLTVILSTDGIRTSAGLLAAGGLHIIYCKAAARLADLDEKLGIATNKERPLTIGG